MQRSTKTDIVNKKEQEKVRKRKLMDESRKRKGETDKRKAVTYRITA